MLMETAMRRYSVLSVNETIVIEYGANKYLVRVVELKPAAVISLCGDVDLEMDFTAPEVRQDDLIPRKPSFHPASIAILCLRSFVAIRH